MEMDARFDVDHACSVDEALSKLECKRYDVIISDYIMPQKSGLQFLKELREAKNEIPFILFTIESRGEVAINALNIEVAGYFCKMGKPETIYRINAWNRCLCGTR
jgi:DNA-binding NarL/FixJ family response regulator